MLSFKNTRRKFSAGAQFYKVGIPLHIPAKGRYGKPEASA